jgi:hypothetical protein
MSNNTAKQSGISKHVHSTNPDLFMSENIYANDTTSKNKDETYQTLDNRTMPIHTDQKINPFNVKGVPGCKQCGGSGWKENAKHPHPCNECAKKTVPNIDTYLTKVGQTATPVREDVIVEKKIPVTEYIEQQRQVPVTHNVEVHKTVPVTESQPVTQNVQLTREVPITREVENLREVPVKRSFPYTENVHITENVPRTTFEDIKTQVPVTRKEHITENILTTERFPYSEENIRQCDYVHGTDYSNTEYATYHGTGYVPTGNIRTGETQQNISHNPMFVESGKGYMTTGISNYRGLPSCTECHGEGYRNSKLTGKIKPCDHCVKATGNCPLCKNSGFRTDKNKTCKCIYAK